MISTSRQNATEKKIRLPHIIVRIKEFYAAAAIRETLCSNHLLSNRSTRKHHAVASVVNADSPPREALSTALNDQSKTPETKQSEICSNKNGEQRVDDVEQE